MTALWLYLLPPLMNTVQNPRTISQTPPNALINHPPENGYGIVRGMLHSYPMRPVSLPQRSPALYKCPEFAKQNSNLNKILNYQARSYQMNLGEYVKPLRGNIPKRIFSSHGSRNKRPDCLKVSLDGVSDTKIDPVVNFIKTLKVIPENNSKPFITYNLQGTLSSKESNKVAKGVKNNKINDLETNKDVPSNDKNKVTKENNKTKNYKDCLLNMAQMLLSKNEATTDIEIKEKINIYEHLLHNHHGSCDDDCNDRNVEVKETTHSSKHKETVHDKYEEIKVELINKALKENRESILIKVLPYVLNRLDIKYSDRIKKYKSNINDKSRLMGLALLELGNYLLKDNVLEFCDVLTNNDDRFYPPKCLKFT